MLQTQQQQQWCPRCNRYVEIEQKQTKLGKRSNLVKIVTICQKCRTTLGSKTTSALVLEQMQPETAAEQPANQ
ncbi:hypothetical protein HYR99_12065 [Candidatus Poribacteria bacterium]|nr:hypothetical protein [Candidatus Poribacteria bacterium]